MTKAPPVSPRVSCKTCPLHQWGIFRHLAPAQLAELEDTKTIGSYRKGQSLFYEGTPPLGVHMVLSGHVKVFRSSSSGRSRILKIAGPGDILGHEALLRNELYPATAQVLEDSTICFLPKHAFLPLLKKNPVILFQVTQKLCCDIGLSERAMADFMDKPVPARLAGLLISLKDKFGQPLNGGFQVQLPFSRGELAEMVGTTLETTVRVLHRLQAQGILTVDHRVITVKDGRALTAIHQTVS